VDPNKIKAMMEWIIPKNLKKLKGFLGLIGYYYKFFNHYGQIVAPITTLLKNEAFCCTQEETKNFEKIEAMFTTLVLDTPNFTKTFIVECDSSGNGIGAILMQEGRPHTFERSQLRGKNLLKPIYEK
jgi:hypothetical protein